MKLAVGRPWVKHAEHTEQECRAALLKAGQKVFGDKATKVTVRTDLKLGADIVLLGGLWIGQDAKHRLAKVFAEELEHG